MAPKPQCNAQKLAQIVAHMQKSRTVFSLKELEKDMVKVAGVSSMQCKDYLQALQDDDKISCEKIGSGNWYFCFTSRAMREADSSLNKVRADHDQLAATVRDIRHKLAERAAQLEEEMLLDGGENDREEMMRRKTVMDAELRSLRKALAAYSDSDPAEFQRKELECTKLHQDAEQYTENVYELEKYIEKSSNEDALAHCRMTFYGEEWSPEDCEFAELATLSET